MKKKFQIMIYALVVCIIIMIAAGVGLFLSRKQVNMLKEQYEQTSATMKANQKSVYVAIADITAGDKLEEGVNVDTQQIYSGIDDAVYMTADDLGKLARINIASGAPIQASMVAAQDITKDSRYKEISVVNLTTDQKSNDIVDVRILFPDGTDYIVIPHTEIRDLRGSVFNLVLNEEEILRLDSAIVDAATLGGRLYTTKYVEANLQDDATPFYPVKQSTIDLIATDPNVLTMAENTLSSAARQSLEERMILIKQSLGEGQTMSADFDAQITKSQPEVTTTEASGETVADDGSLDSTTESEG